MSKKAKTEKVVCGHNSIVSAFPLVRYQKSREDSTLSHYSGTLKAHCKDCGAELVFTGMPRVNEQGTEITLLMVPQSVADNKRLQTLNSKKKNNGK